MNLGRRLATLRKTRRDGLRNELRRSRKELRKVQRQLEGARARASGAQAELDRERQLAYDTDPLRRVSEALISNYGRGVQGGPFAGMQFPEDVADATESLPMTLLGSVERELHHVVEETIDLSPDIVVNVGCYVGYYAVGMAMRSPKAQVWAFDIDSRHQELCRRLAEHNEVEDRVHTAGLCDPEALQKISSGRTVLVVDCEGCELDVLRPDLAPRLEQATILVELHEHIRPGVTEEILDRFSATHDARILQAQLRFPSEYPQLDFLPWGARFLAIHEPRESLMGWAFLTPRDAPLDESSRVGPESGQA